MPTSAKPSPTYLLDTSAILAYLLKEAEGSRVHAVAERAAIPFISIAELYAMLWNRFDRSKADEVIATLKEWQRPWLWPTEGVLLLAGKFRALYRLGLADGLIAALAVVHGVTLVTKDPDFRALRPDLKLLEL
jgi:predicted nucleic acid-binding protein